MSEKPKVNSKGEQELVKMEEQFKRYDEQVKSLTLDQMNKSSIEEVEQQTKVSNREAKSNLTYLKPARSISSREQFNEKYRSQWEEAKKYVAALCENNEQIGEMVEVWTKPFAGLPAEFWQVPTNKPLMMPKHLAEQLASRFYHRFVMGDGVHTGSDGMGQYYGAMAVKETRRRVDARPIGSGFIAMSS
jgi:hypothetical protein